MHLRKECAALTVVAAFIMTTGCKNETRSAPQPAEPQKAASAPAASTTPQIGGEPIVKISRSASSDGREPEFLSLTAIPGRGMNVFQITANIPGKGEIPLLASPTIEEAASHLNGGPGDLDGDASFSFGGAFLIPYPNRILGRLSADGRTITTEWHGKSLTLPANWHNSEHPEQNKHAMHGLILASQVQDVHTSDIPDGKVLTGFLHAGDFGGHWLSQTDLSFTISLTGKSIDAIVVARNVGRVDEPMSIGWHPYFLIPSGQRSQVLLHVPGSERTIVNNYQDVFPTGKLVPVRGTKWDFTAPEGRPLDDLYLDDNWSHLHRTDGAVAVTLADPASNYGIRVLGLSPDIRTVQVYSPLKPPAGNPRTFAAIEQQFNFIDPFGKEWRGRNTGMVTLHPGQSVEWHVRLQLFEPAAHSGQS